MFKEILLGVDGSEHALKAARVASELARAMQANLRVVVCFEPVPAYLGEPNLQAAIDTRMELADEILAAALAEIGSIPGTIHTEKVEGQPAEAILNVAEARSAELIVMGTRGLGRLGGLLLGSQSQKVVAHASCPVLLVR